MICRERLDGLGEILDKIFEIFGAGLVSDSVYDTEHVLGSMIDFAHEEVFLLLALRDVRYGANDACGSSLTQGALEISKPMHLHPADFPASPPEPELDRAGLRIGRIERHLAGYP